MELSIIINSYKNSDLLRLCLKSIQKHIGNLEYEIIVADGATEEDTEMMMRDEFPRIKFFPHAKNVGFQALLKKGIKASNAPYILALNSDIIVTKESIQSLLKYIKDNPDIGLAGPQLLNFNGSLQYSCFRYYKPVTILYRRTFLKKFKFAQKHLDWFLMKEYDHQQPKEADWIMGSAMMIARKAMEKVGPMDPVFFMYMEDVDWCRRFWENNYKVVYFPAARMMHYHGKGSAKGGFFYSLFCNKLTWIHIVSAIKYFNKYIGKPLPRQS